nr:glycine oxidase ThiO [Microbacterium aurantiacum]
MRCDAVVIGGGIVGLSIAWGLVRAGRDVRLVDPAPATGATYAAAGMITPVSEHRPTERALHALAQESAADYPAFLEAIPGGGGCGFEAASTLLVAVDDADRHAIDELAALRPGEVESLTLREARRLEPLLGPRATAVRRVQEHRVDPRNLAAALLAALGDRVVRGAVRSILHEDPNDPMSPAIGVRIDDGVITAREVIVASGLDAARVEGMPFPVTLRPVHGDILRLRVPGRLWPLLNCTLRARVHGSSVYLLPRADGTVVVGATQREHGGASVSAGGVYELLRDATAVVPAVAELELLEATARARPTTLDNAPLLGRAAPGLIIATGFGRHGVMLAPIAAASVAALVDGVAPPHIAPFRPDRFAASPVPLEVS